jgi:signal transduction histidine kinase
MLREGRPIGAITIWRSAVGPFSDQHVTLLQTFADQAVIAVENARLVRELEEKNQAVTDAHARATQALEEQTATSEILRVISASPTDVQPVFDALAAHAARLCDAADVIILRLDGDVLHMGAGVGPLSASVPPGFAFPLTRGSVSGRAIIERRPLHVHDLAAEPEDQFPAGRDLQRRFGHRTMLATPLRREDVALGVICVFRTDVRPFRDTQIDLLQTFADQAVIAIENVRLFTELQEKNRAITEALEQQTATSEILRVISSSPTDITPIFDAIAESAWRLCGATISAVYRFDGALVHFIAHHGFTPEALAIARARFPSPPERGNVASRAIFERAVAHVHDVNEDPDHRAGDYARALGIRNLLGVPMLLDGQPVGAVVVGRAEPGRFSDSQVGLLQTFADQAVIAIENVRLFRELDARTRELTRSVGELRALGEVGQAISSTLDLQTVLRTIVAQATQLAGTEAGVIYEYDEGREVFVPRATERLDAAVVEAMVATPVRRGEGATGRLAEVQESVQIPDILAAPAETRVRDILVRAGYRALLAIPLAREGRLIGGLTVIRKTTGQFAPGIIDLLRTFATQSALAIQNARLFRELELKSRELEVASQHKSEFLASMSHELRTPLNAVIGFSDVLLEGMFGETNEKQTEYLRDILSSGQHLLSLINDILDLSKIEAGRMELDLADAHLPSAIDDALLLMRERAGRRGITLERTVSEDLGEIQADARKVKQVLLNLLSNAVKFTPEGGRIAVRAARVDGAAEISVSDTGVGIAPEDHDAVFEEFRQVGKAERKAEGTGLGLALCRKFVELHGGRIWVTSQLGAGSTFTFTLPLDHPRRTEKA